MKHIPSSAYHSSIYIILCHSSLCMKGIWMEYPSYCAPTGRLKREGRARTPKLRGLRRPCMGLWLLSPYRALGGYAAEYIHTLAHYHSKKMSERHRFCVAGYIRRRRMCPATSSFTSLMSEERRHRLIYPHSFVLFLIDVFQTSKKEKCPNRAHAPHVPGYPKMMSFRHPSYITPNQWWT
jgi:hypothetical protein